MEKSRLAGVYEENVHPAIVVIVENRDARRDSLGKVAALRLCIGVYPINTDAFGLDLAEYAIRVSD